MDVGLKRIRRKNDFAPLDVASEEYRQPDDHREEVFEANDVSDVSDVSDINDVLFGSSTTIEQDCVDDRGFVVFYIEALNDLPVEQ